MALVLAFLELKTHCFLPLFVGLLEIIPYVGNVIGIVLTLIVTALYGADLSMLGGIDLVYGIIQMIQGWVLEPLILEPQVIINPLFTIFALVIGELVWGISGMILAIPMIAMFKIVCDHIEPLKPYGFLIGETETKRKELGFIKKIKRN
jgi:predicted PurR-regulated permease PerM